MKTFAFYFPSNDDDQDAFMHQLWNERTMDYLIYVRRISSRGNPYIKGLFIMRDETTSPPPEFELRPIPDDSVSYLVQQFKEEQMFENNATEYGDSSVFLL